MSKTVAAALEAGLLFLGCAGAAHAALIGTLPAALGGSDYQAYYDDALKVTWLANANLAATQHFGVTGSRGQTLLTLVAAINRDRNQSSLTPLMHCGRGPSMIVSRHHH